MESRALLTATWTFTKAAMSSLLSADVEDAGVACGVALAWARADVAGAAASVANTRAGRTAPAKGTRRKVTSNGGMIDAQGVGVGFILRTGTRGSTLGRT